MTETPNKTIPAIRPARAEDVPRLYEIEQEVFTTDRLSRQSLRRLIENKTSSTLLCATQDGHVLGDVAILFRRGSSLGRIYSLAVEKPAQGRGIGTQLLQAAEDTIRQRGLVFSRLELRADDPGLHAFYQRAGYHIIAQMDDYYEDHCPGIRMEKRLQPANPPPPAPYYAQSLEFTCGPAALLMALQILDPAQVPSRSEELAIWREATTIFMASGHGGCGPHGLALAAHKRGFSAEIFLSDPAPLFVESVRDAEKKKVLQIVHEDFTRRCKQAGLPIHHRPLTVARLEKALKSGATALVLISSWRFYRTREPHWVVVTGLDRQFIYSHDPYVDEDEEGRGEFDSMNIPINRQVFEHMARFGKRQLCAAVIIRKA